MLGVLKETGVRQQSAAMGYIERKWKTGRQSIYSSNSPPLQFVFNFSSTAVFLHWLILIGGELAKEFGKSSLQSFSSNIEVGIVAERQ